MIIDFHTHIFPDSLAPRALDVLCKNIQNSIEPCHDGTEAGLIKNMKKWNIDYCVALPIVTKPSQTQTLNEWAASLNPSYIIPFGSVFPHSPTIKDDIKFVKSLGLKGIKLHAEYQNFNLDSPEMLKVYDMIFAEDLILLHHAGEDDGLPPPYKSSPKQFAKVADEMKGGKLVVAHLGSLRMWNDVYQYLAGKNVYLDTSMGLSAYGEEMFCKIIEKHGYERILFASDAPWSKAGDEIKALQNTPLTSKQKEAIFSGNASRLLSL